MAGTIFSAVSAIRLIPPIMTRPVSTAITSPNTQRWSANQGIVSCTAFSDWLT